MRRENVSKEHAEGTTQPLLQIVPGKEVLNLVLNNQSENALS